MLYAYLAHETVGTGSVSRHSVIECGVGALCPSAKDVDDQNTSPTIHGMLIEKLYIFTLSLREVS